ncbi:hypothetical protein EV356DRAFT_497335 [Viridothelium virens]|uniref:Efficient mitochondria targeting-associated protein 19 n=1 Tax=Viridothelium virens TaxID=1048519 RepID=A0A6A6HGL6_VIRVR|nr:hypothetical protein EV356DRAFT_497335 [Viridothelium virens]
MATSIFSRRLDLLYLVFFAIHIPIMLLVDLAPLYPTSMKPAIVSQIRTWYITTYRDQFFVKPPAWFNAYTWMEAIYHMPLSGWAVGALLRDDPKVPLHLLIFAVQTAMTTLTCITDYLSWSSFSNAEKLELGKLYVPYLILSVFMGVDMFTRLERRLSFTSGGTGSRVKTA